MNLDKKDRLILINQYKILLSIDPQNKSYYENLIEILQSGYTIFYSEMDEWVFEEMPEDAGNFVLQILSLYRAIESYKEKHPEDKEISGHRYSIFLGFDGNNETKLFGFARFLIEKQEKFTEQKTYFRQTDKLNSHTPMSEKYHRMINKWVELGQNYRFENKEEILEILNA